MIFFSKSYPDNDDLILQPYTIHFSLNSLIPGVDNVRYDVHLSPGLCRSVENITRYLVMKHAKVGEIPEASSQIASSWVKIRGDFIQNCIDVMLGAINKAKLEREIQINFLAQTALAKMVLEEIRSQFLQLIEQYKNLIRKHDVSHRVEISDVIRLKEALSEIQKNRTKIICDVAKELFQCIAEAQQNELHKIREANFGSDSILPEDFFINPLIHAENATDDFFMLETYVLFGNRMADPLKYETVLALMNSFFNQFDERKAEPHEPTASLPAVSLDDYEEKLVPEKTTTVTNVDAWLKHVDNIDTVFNYIKSESKLRELKYQHASKNDVAVVKIQIRNRKWRMQQLHSLLKKEGLIEIIAACYAMLPVYTEFCPPLFPHEVINYLTSSKERNVITAKLKRLKAGSGKSVSLAPLKNIIHEIKNLKEHKANETIIRFLKDFVRYNRDLHNYEILKEAMNRINLAADEKTRNLSRVNHTLYEFLLPREQVREEKPIVNHVVIKSDLRGSTDITHQIKERGLNPASYFSLNFFNPITAILSEYGATKVFIEGDAIILSIFEKEETPEDWYSVARACGLAINMLMITQRYNANSKKHRFPVLEQGIGVSHRNSPPTFLLDGENRIMISPAINQADRLSGCSKLLRKKFEPQKGPFNLYVFQTNQIEDLSATADDLYERYNVNGIELNADGFEKLKEEINLKRMKCHIPDFWKEPFIIYTGIFPTISGKYQRLVIREDHIPLVSVDNFTVLRLTNQKYYEVCTQRRLYEYAKQMSKSP
ncbi:MAG: hypothetical protein ACOZF0_20545 [Thermodesulfobacteriota bacterium]